ncbi:hypothetical protein [Novimethylophilus kurashikiensis]|uniref:hypothetical protein n=1 Tax=Novimethylophilus kurashikiensis TaxID=1825523 RepID=UPI0011B22CF0|nr:hypothetical protein [Novimethylophilus kurashikiensis]
MFMQLMGISRKLPARTFLGKLDAMSRFVRRIALLLILVFTANVQCWAFSLGVEAAHEQSENSSFVFQKTAPAQSGSHDCGLAGHHCCHALSHLLGQISDHFSTARILNSTTPIPNMDEAAVSFTPESIYHPPRHPSLT